MKELMKLRGVKVLNKTSQMAVIAGKPPKCDPDLCGGDYMKKR